MIMVTVSCLTMVIPVYVRKQFHILCFVNGLGIMCYQIIKNFIVNYVSLKIVNGVRFAVIISYIRPTGRNTVKFVENVLHGCKQHGENANRGKCHGLERIRARFYAISKVLSMRDSISIFLSLILLLKS